MSNILLLNKIAKVGTDIFDDKYTVSDSCENPDAVMVRSAAMHDMEFPASLKAIARAGAGVNNIPVEDCAKKGIVVFNTPGANANGVKELAIAALLLASRNITGGIEWVKTLAGQEDAAKVIEKNKSAYAGIEIKGKTLGVIGLGAIGGMVANAAVALGMEVIGCDPFLTVEGAWGLSRSVKKAASYEEIFAKSDFISVHVPATKDTKNMFCAESFAKMKDGVRIINLSRSELVNSTDMIKAVADKKVACYVTDFATPDIIGVDNIIVIPHLGASTNESEDNCAVMAAKQLVDYLENGNIVNSVNYPAVVLERGGLSRCCVLHYNVPAVISGVSSAFADAGINVEHFVNRSKGEFAYTVIDFNAELPAGVLDAIKATDGVIAVNVIA
ncbi:MAG: 3-phosphoglycerate dehydrogenase [Clostridia bacterium]|nr:3-phosphoglycerate dehydrogenase [Clostridia bacterium]MBQ8743429.1 3-phosphoglycerate dehydrogenase [Clostridia bacterium]